MNFFIKCCLPKNISESDNKRQKKAISPLILIPESSMRAHFNGFNVYFFPLKDLLFRALIKKVIKASSKNIKKAHRQQPITEDDPNRIV